MIVELQKVGIERPEVVYFPTLLTYARELEKLSDLRRVYAIEDYLDDIGSGESFFAMGEAFYENAKFEIHVNADVIDAYIANGHLTGTRFDFETDLEFAHEDVLYGSVRTYQPARPWRLEVDPYVIERAGLFFPLFPGLYQDKLEFAAGLCTVRGLASMAIAQQLKLVEGRTPEMMLVLREVPDLEGLILSASLPVEDVENDARAFALRRRGINISRVSTR